MSESASPLSSASFTPSRPHTPAALQKLKSLLRHPLRVTIRDGRIFLGTFVGTDKQLNILLINAEEYRIGADYVDGDPNGRYVGQIMLPWRLVKKVEASPRVEETSCKEK